MNILKFLPKKPPPEPDGCITWIKQGDSMVAILPYFMRSK